MTEDVNPTAKVTASELPVATAGDAQPRDRRTLRLSPNPQHPSTGRTPLFRQ
jgi:hypothetical protein